MKTHPRKLTAKSACSLLSRLAQLGFGALLLFASAFAAADVTLGLSEAGEELKQEVDQSAAKAIRIRDEEPLEVAFEPTKSSFAVDESINFNVRGNKKFYLYLFSVDEQANEAVLILPRKDVQKENQYPANRTLPVPNRSASEIFGDKPGRETFVIVASTKYLPVKSGWFRDGADRYLEKSFSQFEEEFASKGIRVRGDRTRDKDVLVKRVIVPVRGDDRQGRDDGQGVTDVWLTTKGNRSEFAVGERIETRFGADADGYVQMYVYEPDGDLDQLKTYRVEEDKTYRMSAIAEDPTGQHAFAAVWTEERPGDGNSKSLQALTEITAKGVRLEEDEEEKSMVIYRFEVVD